jgi:tetratricopeptide (TPR) repeat protein
MAAGDFEKAIPLFRRSIAEAPFVYTAANNLALCFYITGNLEEALRVQSESREAAPFPNPFGLANLASFRYIAGDEVGARRDLDEALKAAVPSSDACVKLCETLARFKRHQALLDMADASGYRDDSGVCFFTGIAASNLGDRRRAKHDLGRVTLGHHKADMTRRYLQHLRDGSSPHTVRGDWPYLLPYEVCSFPVIEAELQRDQKAWLARRIVVDICEVVLNDMPDNPADGIGALLFATHPEATELLWLIAKGSFGPDSLRIAAMQGLKERGATDPKQSVEVLLNGERREITLTGTRLNADFRFGEPLPKTLDALYAKTVKAGYKKRPDWEALGANYLRIMKEAPEYYPARYNYAVSLLHRKRVVEAEPILRELVATQPEYLFAHATLLQILSNAGRKKQADALFKATAVPEETHPDAMIAWLVAQTFYHESAEHYEEARRCLETAHDINPDNPSVKSLWTDYEDEKF